MEANNLHLFPVMEDRILDIRYRELACAIIKQAVEDYADGEIDYDDMKEVCTWGWYLNIDPDAILDRAERYKKIKPLLVAKEKRKAEERREKRRLRHAKKKEQNTR